MHLACYLLSSILIAITGSSAAAKTTEAQVSTSPISSEARKASPERAATEPQIRAFFQLSGEEVAYRTKLLENMDANRSKAEPYWPESFWDDLKKALRGADLTGVFAPLYERHISADMMEEVNRTLKTMSVSDLASTPTGSRFCELQQSMDAEGQQLMISFTQYEFEKVYERRKAEIKAARAKYLATHPDWKD
jgi:hypothetical protein